MSGLIHPKISCITILQISIFEADIEDNSYKSLSHGEDRARLFMSGLCQNTMSEGPRII